MAARHLSSDDQSIPGNRKPGHRFWAEHALCFGPGGFAGHKYSSTEKGQAGALRPVVGWLRKYPGHSGKLGRIPLAKWRELWANEAAGSAKRYQAQLRKHGFIRRVTHQHEPYIEVAYWDTDVERDHLAARKLARLEADRQRLGQTPRAKKDQIDPTACAIEAIRSTTEALSDSRSHVGTHVSRLRPIAISEGLTEADFHRAEHNLPPVFSLDQKLNIQQPAQPIPTPAPPPVLTQADDVEAKSAAMDAEQQEPVGAAGAAVGRCFNFDPRSGLSLTEQMLAWAATRTPRPELEVDQEPTRPRANLGFRPKEALLRATPLLNESTLMQTVLYVNAQFNLKLDVRRVLASKISASSLTDAAYFTSVKHAETPFDCPEAAVMHSAMQREKGLWGARAA